MIDFNVIAQHSKSNDEALGLLKQSGATPIEAIKALIKGRGLSLADCKTELMASPAWKIETVAADRLHEQIVELFDRIDDG